MATQRLSSNSISLAGEFATLSQLVLRGFDANLTLGNTKEVDVLVSDPRSGAMYRLEVKTSARKGPGGNGIIRSRLFGDCYQWIMHRKHETLTDPALYYCFVHIAAPAATSFRFFVVPSKVVADYVRTQHELWLGGDAKRKDTSMRAFRLGVGDPESYSLPTPSADQYENNWTFSA